MNLDDLIQETWSALTANRGRSGLTILGIVIGIAAVITMNAIIGGVSEAQSKILGANASRIVSISLSGIDGFDSDDVEALMQNVHGYDYIVSETNQASLDLNTGIKTVKGSVMGVEPKFFEARAYNVVAGETFTEQDESTATRVVVLSQYSVKSLFGCSDLEAIGKALTIGGDEYRVIGVTNKVDEYEQYMLDMAFCLVPYSTACARITGNTGISKMECMTALNSDIDSIMASTQAYLTQRYKLGADSDDEDDFSSSSARKATVRSNKSLIDQLSSSMASFQAIMVIVSGISLIVGGIGIMNMMLTNVTERIREIGLRKALGAKRADITSQFMLESVCLCLAGGLIGVILGIVGAFTLSGFVVTGMTDMMGSMDDFTPIIDVTSIVNAVLVCTVTGLLFGWYPARQAARLDPVESLNHQ